MLQLANFDLDVLRAPLCVADADPLQRFTPTGDQGGVPSIPRNGVLLTVGIAAKSDRSPGGPGEWPASLEPYPGNADPVCAQMHEQATWRARSGVIYWASAGWGRSAAQGDIDALHRAFETLLFPHPRFTGATTLVLHEDPFAFFQSEGGTSGRRVQEGPTPRVVLDSVMCGEDVLTFFAYRFRNHPKGVLQVEVGSSGPWRLCENAELFGAVIPPEVARVELVTLIDDAEPRPLGVLEVPMHIVQLPASLRTGQRFVWTLVTGYREYIREVRESIDDTDDDAPAVATYVVGYDRNGDVITPANPFGRTTSTVTTATAT